MRTNILSQIKLQLKLCALWLEYKAKQYETAAVDQSKTVAGWNFVFYSPWP
jgi:hypothetical protein